MISEAPEGLVKSMEESLPGSYGRNARLPSCAGPCNFERIPGDKYI